MSGSLDQRRYIIEKQLLPEPVRELIFGYANLKHDTGQLMAADWRIRDAPRVYGDALTETLLEGCRGAIERIAGAELYPTYSYLRVHHHGAHMESHTDRDACEVGITVNIGGDAWPIWIRPGNSDVRVDLSPGDAMVYKGREAPHWREKFEGSLQVQVMLFYVKRLGAFAEHRFDGREGLGMPYAPPSSPKLARKDVPGPGNADKGMSGTRL